VPGRIFDHISATLATTPRNGSDETHFAARGSIGSSVSSHLAESECVRLNTRVEKLDLEFAVADGAALSDELVEAVPRDDALSIGIGVRAVAGAWRRGGKGRHVVGAGLARRRPRLRRNERVARGRRMGPARPFWIILLLSFGTLDHAMSG